MKRLFLLALLALAACDDYGACLASHPEQIMITSFINAGNGVNVPYFYWVTTDHCDRWQYPDGRGPNAS